MNVDGMKIVVKELIKENLEIVPLFRGHAGCGKTEGSLQAAEELIKELEEPVAFIPVRLRQMEEGDTIGFPIVEEVEGVKVLKWSIPGWLPTQGYRPCEFCDTKHLCNHKCNRGIIFLDELPRAREAVRDCVFQFLEPHKTPNGVEHRLHSHIMPNGFKIIAAGNYDTNEYSQHVMDRALLGRLCQLSVETDVKCWLTWGQGKVSKEILGFIATNPAALCDEKDIPESPAITSKRTWYYGNQVFLSNLPDRIKLECYTGLVGTTRARQFVSWLKEHYSKPIQPEDVLIRFSEVKKDFLNRNRDSKAATVSMMKPYLEKCPKGVLTKKNLDNLARFGKLLDPDLAFMFIGDLMETFRPQDKKPTDGCVRSWLRDPTGGIKFAKHMSKVFDSIKKEGTNEEETKT